MRVGFVILAGAVLAIGVAALAVGSGPSKPSSLDDAVAQTRDGQWQQGLAFAQTCPAAALTTCASQIMEAMAGLPDSKLSENPRLALDALIGLGAIQVRRQHYFDAITTLERGIALHDRLFADPLPDIVPAYRLLLMAIAPLGERHDTRGRTAAARALEIANAKLPSVNSDRADLLEAIAALHSLRGRWPEAKTHYFELVAVERALARGDDSRFATMLMDFGITELFTGNPMGFEAAFDEGLALLKRIDSPNYRSAVDVRANFLARAGRCADAQAAAAAYEQEFREKTGSVEFLADGSCRPVY